MTNESTMGLHTYSNGAMSDCFIKRDGDSSERLIIGTNKKRTYLRFQILRFNHDTEDKNMERSISFSPEYAAKIVKSIKAMGF